MIPVPSRRLRITLALVAVAFAAVWAWVWLPSPLITLAEKTHPRVIYRGDPRSAVVALTIDDGPDPRTTPAILEVLARHDAHATFFLLGDRVRAHPGLVERIRDGGHEIGNHLMYDEVTQRLGRARFEVELAAVDSLLGIEGPDKWFRPGSGLTDDWMIEAAARQGYRCVLASAYVQDARLRSPALVTRLLSGRARAGDIVVLHEGPGRDWTPKVLEELIPRWQERGWEVGTVGRLVAASAPSP